MNNITLFFIDVVAVKQAHFGEGSGDIYLGDVSCGGNETSLLHCQANINPNDCSHSEDAGVRCGGMLLQSV